MTITIKNILPNKNGIIFGTTATLATILGSNAAKYIFPGNFNILVWSTVFSVFLLFYRFGDNKNTQFKLLIIYSILTIIVLAITGSIMLLPRESMLICMFILIFICGCTSRYLKRG